MDAEREREREGEREGEGETQTIRRELNTTRESRKPRKGGKKVRKDMKET